MRNIAAEIDAWLERQADEYMARPEPCEGDEYCECPCCMNERMLAAMEDAADAEYEEYKLRRREDD